MWLDRLPPEYRRRYYTNLAVLAGIVIAIFVIGRLGKQNGALAILALMALLVLFACIWPLVRLLKSSPRPGRAAFALYASWILAYVYFWLALAFPGIPGAGIVGLIGILLMLTFFVVYRKAVFPDLFGGGLRERWKAVRGAQRAERAEFESKIDSFRES